MKPYVRVGVPVLLAVLTALGLWLLFSGSSQSGESDGPGNGTSDESADDGSQRLPISQTDMESVAELGSFEPVPSTEDFMTARLDDDSQLDVSFTIAPEDEEAFLAAAGLPDPREDQRVITHASPLWDMNVAGTIRSVADSTGEVTRAVELVEEDGRTRVRMVITPAD